MKKKAIYLLLSIFISVICTSVLAQENHASDKTKMIAENQPMSNTGTPQTGQYTPGGRTPQAGVGGSAPSGNVNSNTGAEDYYYDPNSATWKRKNQ